MINRQAKPALNGGTTEILAMREELPVGGGGTPEPRNGAELTASSYVSLFDYLGLYH